MSKKHKFSILFLLVGILIGIFFYILGQNYTKAEKYNSTDTLSEKDFDLISNLSGIIKESRKKYLVTFDLDSDSSFQRYLSDDNPLSDPLYHPIDLIPIKSYFTYNNASKFQLRSSASIAFADMARAFQNAFSGQYRFYLVSAYRSYGSQSSLVKKGCEDNKCAEPGASEHQAGLAVDIQVASKNGKILSMHTGTDFYKRMDQNSHKYGFHNTYKKGVEIDGKIAEHRHRRFLGIPFARYLYENDITIAEYFNMLKRLNVEVLKR